ncbi:hypothetical protein FIU87_04945 [Bacillus sp. THAF10]|uniref:hypothetical protein n=1 Tax=Bacillus sp. THAF10 TaxID=2587848 RepID=UPI001268865A|nr:hypothetical protein [Bacillus sp. THAF10]QFT87997.1 hypothetical protein FIU87_04945 [Bacillus sp. THAF10]
MNRKVAVFLITWFLFLIWVYCAVYIASTQDWWGALSLLKHTDELEVWTTSYWKVLRGGMVFTLLGICLYFLIGRLDKNNDQQRYRSR